MAGFTGSPREECDDGDSDGGGGGGGDRYALFDTVARVFPGFVQLPRKHSFSVRQSVRRCERLVGSNIHLLFHCRQVILETISKICLISILEGFCLFCQVFEPVFKIFY